MKCYADVDSRLASFGPITFWFLYFSPSSSCLVVYQFCILQTHTSAVSSHSFPYGMPAVNVQNDYKAESVISYTQSCNSLSLFTESQVVSL